ncbi:MAG: alpha/beta fold hydrolase [Actinomycetota bacterium]
MGEEWPGGGILGPMALASTTRGRGTRLVLAHGFTQNGRCWGPFAADLAADHEVMTVDLPGHGDTAADHDQADLPAAASLLAATGGEAVHVGYSLGGRVALHAALAAPDRVRGLVLIGATAGIDEAEARAERRIADGALADRLLAEGLDAFLDRWLRNPLFAGLSPDAQHVEARLTNRPDGLAASLRHCGTGTQEPLWERLGSVGVPVLVVAGADDAKFSALGRRLVEALPRAELAILPASHAVHLERPTTTAQRIRTFLTDHGLDRL